MKPINILHILIIALILPMPIQSQSLYECIEIAMNNNLQIQAAILEVRQAKVLQKTAFNPNKMSVSYEQDPLTSDWVDKKLSVTQSFEFPTVYVAQRKMLNQEILLAEKRLAVTKNEITKIVSEAYFNLCHAEKIVEIFKQQDNIYAGFVDRATIRYNSGDCNRLELINAQSRAKENNLQLNKAKADLQYCQLAIQELLGTQETILTTDMLAVLSLQKTHLQGNPILDYYSQQVNVGNTAIKVERNKLLPDIFGSYSLNDTKLSGFQIGISLPLFFSANKAKIKSTTIHNEQLEIQLKQTQKSIQNAYYKQYNHYLKAKESLEYYETVGIAQADEISKIAETAYNLGEIGYIEYIQNLQMAIGIKLQYIDALNDFNQSIITLNYLKGEK